MLHLDQPYLHRNPNKVMAVTQLISNSSKDMGFMVAKVVTNMAVVLAEPELRLVKATKTANTEATKLLAVVTTMATASNVVVGAAIMDTNWPHL